MASEPMPENPFPPSAFYDAYNQCLAFEAVASRVQPIAGCPPPVVCARLLGHLLRLAPAGDPRGQLQRDIAAINSGHKTFMELGAFYANNFIRAFKRSSGPTPAPSEHPSCPSFKDAHEYALDQMKECKGDHRTARTLAMYRDNDCCLITGLKDFKKPGGKVGVQTAHIIPESVNKNIEGHAAKCHQSASVWSILSVFHNDSIIQELAGHRINRPENILSLNIQSHQFFDELILWLKPIDGSPHTYRVCTANDSLRHNPPLPEYVTFSTTTEVPLPCRKYLALHALCCEVAWMSGAAEYIMDIERRLDDTTVLANDGTSAELLMAAFWYRMYWHVTSILAKGFTLICVIDLDTASGE